MSRQERLMMQGWLAEKKHRLRELETEMKGLISVVRNALPPFLDLDMIDARLACESSRRLLDCDEERRRLLDEMREQQKEWGESL